MDCNEARPLLAAHALGALDGEERSALEQHLSGCVSCEAELEEDRSTAQRLPFVVSLKEPPPSLKAKLMARIEALEAAPAPAERPPRAAAARALGLRPMFAVAASFAAVAAFLVGWTVYETVRVNTVHDRNEKLTATVKALEGRSEQLADTVKTQWGLITLAANPGVAAAPFKGSPASPNTWGTLLVNKEEQQAVLMVVNLAPPGKGEVYQVWLWEPGSGRPRVPGATFRTLADGYGVLRFQPSVAPTPNMSFGASREPEGGSPSPTSPMLFLGSLPADR